MCYRKRHSHPRSHPQSCTKCSCLNTHVLFYVQHWLQMLLWYHFFFFFNHGVVSALVVFSCISFDEILSGNWQQTKIEELFGKSGHEAFRNNNGEYGAKVRHDMERRVNIKGLGDSTGDTTRVLNMLLLQPKQPHPPSPTSPVVMPPSPIDQTRATLAFFQVFKIYHICLTSVSLYIVFSVLELPLSPHLRHFHPSFRSKIKNHFT